MEFDKHIPREEVYSYKMLQKVQSRPKTLLEVAKAKDNLRANLQTVDLDKQMPRDNLVYHISTHMNLKDIEAFLKKNVGKHAVFGNGVHRPKHAKAKPTPLSREFIVENTGPEMFNDDTVNYDYREDERPRHQRCMSQAAQRRPCSGFYAYRPHSSVQSP